jgi:uncharacterized protein YjbI with pentapeptide repeats
MIYKDNFRGTKSMVNIKHLILLKKGSEAWNQWRLDNPEIKPVLSGAYLIGLNLSGANLSRTNLGMVYLNGVNLCEANLSNANLNEANLSEANLSNANLRKANLRKANLRKANLSNANLMGAILSGADLKEAEINGTILSEAILRKVNLSETDINKANLIRANFSDADLIGVNLSGVNLSKANLSNANLSGVNLSKANLSKANLSGAILTTTRLINTNLDKANLTGAHLWETQRAGWSIKRVICEYVYWDEKAKEKTEYATGEFEKLFAKQTKIRLFYKDGISPLEIATLPALIQHLSNSYPGCNLRFVNIHEDSGGAMVELAIEDIEEKSPKEIETLRLMLKAEADQHIQTLRKVLKSKEGEIKKLEGKVEGLKETITELWEKHKGDTYNIHGQVGAVGRNARAKRNTLKSTPAKNTRRKS